MNNGKSAFYGSVLLLAIAFSVAGVYRYLAPGLDSTGTGRGATVDNSDSQTVPKAVESKETHGSKSPGELPERVRDEPSGRPSTDKNESQSEDTPFAKRVDSYLSAIGYEGTPQERVREHLGHTDLPELYQMLEHHFDRNGYLNILAAICILEEDKGKAFSAVSEYLKHPVDWKSFISNELEYEYWIDRYNTVLTLGYLNYRPANDFLVSLLSIDEATKLVLESAGPEENWVSYDHNDMLREALESSSGRGPAYAWIEHCAIELGRNAAYGLAILGDESAFQHVEDAYRTLVRDERARGLSVKDEVWKYRLEDTICRYRFFKDKGWEEAFQIVSHMDWQSEMLLYESYCPNPEEF